MTIASEIQRINNNIASAYTACNSKGATMPVTQNSANLATCIGSITAGGSSIGIPREVSSGGVYQVSSSVASFNLPSNATDVSSYALNRAYNGCTSITSADLSSLTTISGTYALASVFEGCTNLATVDLSSLTTISGPNALTNAFLGCFSLTSVNLSSLTTISGSSSLASAFESNQNYTSLITSITFSSLSTLTGSSAFQFCFRYREGLQSISFPALTSTSFGTRTNQFNSMLTSVTGCTVHFPSNLQSVIGSWTSVVNGFGGTNTTILFDLTATT